MCVCVCVSGGNITKAQMSDWAKTKTNTSASIRIIIISNVKQGVERVMIWACFATTRQVESVVIESNQNSLVWLWF